VYQVFGLVREAERETKRKEKKKLTVETSLVCDIVNQQDTHSTSIVSCRNSSETFLSCRIPLKDSNAKPPKKKLNQLFFSFSRHRNKGQVKGKFTICNLIRLPSNSIVRILKSIPIVVMKLGVQASSQNRSSKHDFPTPVQVNSAVISEFLSRCRIGKGERGLGKWRGWKGEGGEGERGDRIFDQRTRTNVPESPMSNIYRQINKSERSVIRKSKVMAPRELMTGGFNRSVGEEMRRGTRGERGKSGAYLCQHIVGLLGSGHVGREFERV